MSNPTKKTWMSLAGGTIMLTAGVIGLIRGLFWIVLGKIIGGTFFDFPGLPLSGTPSVVLSVVVIYGGISALKRKSWWWAFAGSVCSFFGWWVLVAPAVILLILSKKEFE